MVSASLLASLLFSSIALASDLQLRQAECTSDDACKGPCYSEIRSEGVNLDQNQIVKDEARRRFGDAHCINKQCSCAITSDDQAQDFCKFWIENAKEEFKGAIYLNGGVDAGRQTVYCVFKAPA